MKKVKNQTRHGHARTYIEFIDAKGHLVGSYGSLEAAVAVRAHPDTLVALERIFGRPK